MTSHPLNRSNCKEMVLLTVAQVFFERDIQALFEVSALKNPSYSSGNSAWRNSKQAVTNVLESEHS